MPTDHARPTSASAVGESVEVVDQPGDRDEVDPVADQRDRHAEPQQREVALAEGAHHREAGHRGTPYRGPAMVIAIDGPAGAGKSTVARAVAAALGWTYLDTGAMYRCAALRPGRDPRELDIRFDGDRVLLDGEDVTEAIRTPAAGQAASRIATDPEVRAALGDRQRALLRTGDWVAEGRDIGTVVKPDAEREGLAHRDAQERARAGRRGIPAARPRRARRA